MKDIITKFNELTVEDYSVAGQELEYVLVEDTPDNRLKIELAASDYLILNYGEVTIRVSDLLIGNTDNDLINLVGIIYDVLTTEDGSKVGWSRSTGFVELIEDFSTSRVYQTTTGKGEVLSIPELVVGFYRDHPDYVLSELLLEFENTDRSDIQEWYWNCKGKYSNNRANAQVIISSMKVNGYSEQSTSVGRLL